MIVGMLLEEANSIDGKSKEVDDNLASSEAAAGAFSEQPEISEEQPFDESSVRKRAQELFPNGARVPAVAPRQPPIVNEASAELCAIALKISEEVSRVHGHLDGYATIGYLVADHMGLEVLNDEAVKVGIMALRVGILQATRRCDTKSGERVPPPGVGISTSTPSSRRHLSAAKFSLSTRVPWSLMPLRVRTAP